MSAVDLFAEIIKEHAPENIWQESPLIGYRRLGNTNRGEIGEEFVRRYLTASGIKVANGSRASKTDMQIAGKWFEIKTASLGAKGTFQFNHVRLDREYAYLLCLAVCPLEIRFNTQGRRGRGKGGEVGQDG